MRQADPEKKRPHRSKDYLATHKKKDDADAKNKDRNKRLDRLENLITERPELAQNLNGRVAWEGDALQEVLGKEKIGQVHGMGLLPTPKQVYGRTPRYLKNINMTRTDGSPYEVEHDVWEVIAKMQEHIKKQDQIIKDMNNKEGYVNNGIEEENLQSNDNGISRSPVLLGKTKRIQCNGPVEACSSMQHDIPEDNNLSRSHEKVMHVVTLTHVTKIEYKIISCSPLLCHGTMLATMMSTNYKFNKIHHHHKTLLLILC
ncbi:uncharacterized protein [Triticum aestivum]|uniref:uncharacterized protein n=1 Tax=Triticum aestivum TaxID=4565 RepID=UPI001D00CF5B|nr:uncharacterized protein LOC123094373 [Triticum aestivum]